MKKVKKLLKSIDVFMLNKVLLSLLVILMGILVMVFKKFGLVDINLYASSLFYIYSFLSILIYFLKRKNEDYEILLLSLINVITATYIFGFKEFDVCSILGSSMLIYTILIISNRVYKILKLRNDSSFMWIIKSIITFLIGFVGVLAAINLYNNITLQTLMYSFYFIMTGLLMLIENIVEIFITEDKARKIFSSVIEEEENKLEEINEKKELDVKVVPVKKVETKKEVKPKKVKKVETKKEVKPKEAKKVETKKEVKPKEVKKVETKKEVKPKEVKKVKTKKEVKPKEVKKAETKKEVKPKEVKKVENKKKVGRPKKVTK